MTRYCTRPSGMLWGLPRVGGTKSPEIPRILDLSPDLVFANAEENRKEDVDALRSAGVEVDVTLPKTVSEVPAAIRHWGRRLGTDAEAEALAERIESARRALESRPARPRFRYAYWIWKDPWMTISDDTYVADLLRLAGGENVYGGEAARYPTTHPSEALAREPEVHLFASEPYPFTEEKHGALGEKLFGGHARRLVVEGDDFCWHGVRTLEGLRRAADLNVSAD